MPTRVLPELGWPFAAPHLLMGGMNPEFPSAESPLGCRMDGIVLTEQAPWTGPSINGPLYVFKQINEAL
jgi:hypothetical protein